MNIRERATSDEAGSAGMRKAIKGNELMGRVAKLKAQLRSASNSTTRAQIARQLMAVDQELEQLAPVRRPVSGLERQARNDLADEQRARLQRAIAAGGIR